MPVYESVLWTSNCKLPCIHIVYQSSVLLGLHNPVHKAASAGWITIPPQNSSPVTYNMALHRNRLGSVRPLRTDISDHHTTVSCRVNISLMIGLSDLPDHLPMEWD